MSNANLILAARQLVGDANDACWKEVVDQLATALETSEKARAEAEGKAKYYADELAKLRHELVTYKRDAQPVVDLVEQYQRAVDGSKYDHRLLCQIIRIKLPKGTK